MRNRAARRWLSVCFTVCFLLTAFAVSQDPDEQNRLGRKDDPAAREQWFRRGRQTRNGQPAAKMLHQAHIAKMRMRAQRESQFRAATTAHHALSGNLSASVGTWTNLGPRPIVDNTAVPNGYGPLAGRVTAVVVDQTDATGNTVLAAGAYGGVWRSINAAASDPSLVQWTPLIDDQPTLAVGAIALQPGNSNVVLVGTGEPDYAFDSYYGVGILRSTDGGKTWNTINNASTPSGSRSLYGSGVSQFAFSTKNTNTVVASTSFATVYPSTIGNAIAGTLLSTDAGATWTVIPFTNDNSKFYAASASSVVYNPKEDKFYAVLPYFGVYVSQGTSAAGFTSFIRLKNQPGKTGVLSTTACPASFSANCPLLRGTLTVRPVASASDPDQMFIWFVADGNGDAKDDQGIWKSSTDSTGTVTWTSVSDSGIQNCGDSYGCGTTQSFYNLYLNAVPNGTNTDLYAGTINIYKCSITSANPTCTATPFKNLTHVYGCSNISQVHPDQHAMDFLLSNPAIAYFGNDGGVNRSLSAQTNLNSGSCTGAANAFDNLNSHIGPLTQFMWGSNHPTDPNTLMGGSQDNGTMAMAPSSPAPGDAGWWEINGGDGGYNWIDPVTPTNWYSAYTGVSVQYCTSTINCNTNIFAPIIEEDLSNGSTHQVNGDYSNFYTPYILDPARPTQILVGTCRVWRGGNSAASWPSGSNQNALSHKLGTTSDTVCNIDDDPIQALAAGGPSGTNGSKVIYAGTSHGHVYMTTHADTGITAWTDITGSINPNGFPISGVALDPQDPTGMTAYAVIQGFMNADGGHVWRTGDGGANWDDISSTRGALPDAPVNDIVIDPDTRMLYVATDIGVYTSIPGGAWNEIGYPYAPGYLPNVAVLHVAIFKNGTDKRLRAWTHGRGVWETLLAATPDLTISTESLQFTAVVNSSSNPQSVVLTNTGSSSITLGTPSLSTSSEFSLASSTCGASLAVNASCSINLIFQPTVPGETLDRLFIPNSSVSQPSLWVDLAGNATNNATDFAFNFGSSPTSVTVTAGQTAVFNFNVDSAPTAGLYFTPSVNFVCSGLPSRATCSFNPSPITSAGAETLSITTAAATQASVQPGTGPLEKLGLYSTVFALSGFLLLGPGFVTASRRRALLRMYGTFLVAILLIGIIACGGGSSSSNSTTKTTIPGTPPGTYSVTITGTYGNVIHTQIVTLTVQ
jgi:hypothetical protein